MKRFLSMTLGLFVCLALTSCANYSAVALTNLSSDFVHKPFNLKDVSVGCKILDARDCKKYLGRNVIKAGFQPIQLTLRNNGLNTYLFSASRIDLPCVKPDEVASKVHTSTIGRSGVYGALGIFTCGLFLIPAVVDGVKSHNANEELDRDYSRKSRDHLSLTPHAHLNTILFVPAESFYEDFSLTLINEDTSEPVKITVHARS